nr:cation:dicarboxylase symporter family transporter [Elizabethkingia argenteiflava]
MISNVGFIYLFPLEKSSSTTIISNITQNIATPEDWKEKMVRFFTVGEFYMLLSRHNMLAMLIFAFLLGIVLRHSSDENTDVFRKFMPGGNEVMKELLRLIMKIAPIGLGAYIAYQAGTLGSQFWGFYAKPLGIFHAMEILYFFVFFSLYAFIGRGPKGIKLFWKNNILPSFTAISTCSSLATMPTNLETAKK